MDEEVLNPFGPWGKWDDVRRVWIVPTMLQIKTLDRNETGMVLAPEDNARGGGSRWPYPHRGDATEIHPGECRCGHGTAMHECPVGGHVCQWCGCGRPVPVGASRPGGGQTPEEVGATEPPRDFNPQEAEDPQGSQDGSMPKRRGVPPRPNGFPSQNELDDKYPQGGISSRQSPGGSVGGR